jgi:hypothetical protein
MICKNCGKNPLYEYSLEEYVTYLRCKYKEDWVESRRKETCDLVKEGKYLAAENTWFPLN